jgi:periplasmic divalent cation tolerance protein
MSQNREMAYIFWSCKEKAEAKRIIQSLLEQRLIACASIFPEVESIYRWEGNVEETKEIKVILKTATSHFNSICDHIKENCSYEVPEIVQMNVNCSYYPYFSWLIQEVI